MAITRSRYRTATSAATLVAFAAALVTAFLLAAQVP